MKTVTVISEFLFIRFDMDVNCKSDMMFSANHEDCMIFVNDHNTEMCKVKAQLQAYSQHNCISDDYVNQIASYETQRQFYDNDDDFNAKNRSYLLSCMNDVQKINDILASPTPAQLRIDYRTYDLSYLKVS